MSQTGLFTQILNSNYCDEWFSDKNVRYVQQEIANRLGKKYLEYIEVDCGTIKMMLIKTFDDYRFPLTRDELLEMVICNFTEDINTQIEHDQRFSNFDPRILYKNDNSNRPGTDITMQEKVKVKHSPKLEFQMNY